MQPSGKIGFFDSGVGGLSIARQIVATLPHYSYLYVGDTAHQPFGPKPAADVRGYVQSGVKYLSEQGCELVIITCNTATAQALRFVQQQFLPQHDPERRVLGVIVPTAEAAVAASKTQIIGVLATKGTVEARSFAEEIQKLRPDAMVYQQAAPELVPFIEAGLHHSPEIKIMLRHYLHALAQTAIDTLILGCTHYELIHDVVAELLPRVTIIRQNQVVAQRLQEYLTRHSELSKRLDRSSGWQVCYTSHAESFAMLGQEFFGSPLSAKQVTL